MGNTQHLTIVLQPDLGEVRRVSKALDVFAEANAIDGAQRHTLELVLDELLTNTMTYGYAAHKGIGVTVDLRCDENAVHVRVQDDAAPFNPADAPAPDIDSDLDHRRIGGLGLFFVREFTSSLSYRSEGNHNILEFDVAKSGPSVEVTL